MAAPLNSKAHVSLHEGCHTLIIIAISQPLFCPQLSVTSPSRSNFLRPKRSRMGKSTAKSSFSQVQSMRARLRKASCMSDESYEDDNLPHGPLHLQPWAPTSRLEAAACPPASQRRSNNGQIDDQLESALFTKLPVELRRMIYTELWRSSNPLMKMHIHGSANGPKLVPTPCQYEPKATFSTRDDEVDPMRTDPWPAWRSRNQPPRWFWHAWGLRLRWGVHWKCQAMAMLNWNPRVDGTCEDLSGTDGRWLGCFLTCRKMLGAFSLFSLSTAPSALLLSSRSNQAGKERC